MRRVILTMLSDSHGGSKFGLMGPNVTLYEEGEDGELLPYTPRQTWAQIYLWELYQEGLERVKALAGSDEIIADHNGDECHGSKYPQSLVSTRIADQILIATDNLRPLLGLPTLRACRINAGTGAHSFLEGSSAILVSEMLAREYPDKDVRALYHGLLDIGGYTVDYSHHGPPPGSRSWLKGNVARYYLQSLMLAEITAGRKPPNLVVRSHYHEPVWETVRLGGYTSDIVITPSLCLLDEHSRQATRSTACVTNGITAFEIVDGKLLEAHAFYKTMDIRTKETL